MKTNHRRNFVASKSPIQETFHASKKLASGREIWADSKGCQHYHHAAEHIKASIKKTLRQLERRDAIKVIAEQIGEINP